MGLQFSVIVIVSCRINRDTTLNYLISVKIFLTLQFVSIDNFQNIMSSNVWSFCVDSNTCVSSILGPHTAVLRGRELRKTLENRIMWSFINIRSTKYC